MSGLYDSQAGSRIVQFWIGSAVLAALALTVGVPAWRQRNRAENERAAATALKMLTSAEANFRASDLDGNKINDFWTGDVAGLYFLSPAGLPLALIPQDIAEADGKPLRPVVREPKPYHGYFFVALDLDESLQSPGVYREDTDGVSGKVHNRSRFGFCAYPADPGYSGRCAIIVNENNSLFWYSEWSGPPPTAWPGDEQLKAHWGRRCGLRPTSGDAIREAGAQGIRGSSSRS
jgi:hypothetical protein